MKRLLFFTALLLLSIASFSQDSTTVFKKAMFNGDMYEYFGKRLIYPMSLGMSGVQGYTTISFRINERGIIDTINIESTADRQMSDDVVKILSSTQNMWSSTIMNGNAVPYWYKLIVDYKSYAGTPPSEDKAFVLYEKAKKKYEKAKYSDALSIIHKAILLNPYSSVFYKLRSKIYESQNDIENATIDDKKSVEIEQNVFGVFTVISYSTTVTRTL